MRNPKIPKAILDRRRSIRVQETLAFQIGSRGYETQARTVNISCQGALCVVDRNIPMMTKLDIALKVPGQRVMHLKGVVVRKDPDPWEDGKYHVAIFFSDLRPADEKHLKQFIEKRLKG